jgi:hypothetical protein
MKINSILNYEIPVSEFKFQINSFIISFLAFLISLVLCHFYVGGDQYAYMKVYNMMPNLGFIEAQLYYQKYLTSRELVHFIFIFIFSRIAEKAVFISIFNSLLVYSALVLFRRLGVNFLISATILLTNYYVYVLFIPAERLKFGILFLLVSLIFANSQKKSIFYSLLSIFAHFQMAIIYSALVFEHSISKVKVLLINFKLSIHLIFLLLFPILVFLIFYDAILHKVSVAMINSNGLRGILKPLIFLLGALIYAKNRVSIVYMFIPLIIAAFFLGDSRVNMFCFFIFLYAALPVKNGWNIGIFMTILYFGLKSFFFIEQVIKYGNGFYL